MSRHAGGDVLERLKAGHKPEWHHSTGGDAGYEHCAKCHLLWPCDASRLIAALEEALLCVPGTSQKNHARSMLAGAPTKPSEP